MKFYNSKAIYFIVFFWIFMALFAVFLLSGHPIDSDEGVVLNPAWQMWQGKEMYVDFFEFTSPGSAFLVYFLWLVLGAPSYLAAKLLSIIFLLFSAAGIFLIIRKAFKNYYWPAVASFLWLLVASHYPVINYNSFSSFAAVWLLYFLIQAIDSEKKRSWLFVGIMCALVFWLLQTKGLFLFGISFLVILFFSKSGRWKNILVFISSFFASSAILFFPWLTDNLIYSLFIFPWRTSYLEVVSPSHLWLYAEIIILVIEFILCLLYKRKDFWILVFFQSGLFLSSFNIIDRMHFMINFFPSLILLILAFNGWQSRFLLASGRLLIWSYLAVVILIFNPNILFYGFYGANMWQDLSGTIFSSPEIKSARYIYSGPFLPGLYFEFKKPNPFYLINNLATCPAGCLNRTLEIFKEVKPEFAILDYAMVEKYHYNQNNIFDNYIKENYKSCGHVLGQILLMARDECPKNL